MLVLTRQAGECILVGEDIEVRILRIDGDQVRVGIVAPRQVPIRRGELVEDIRRETASAVRPPENLVTSLSARIKAAGPALPLKSAP